jgi:hypothetical protein
MTKAVAKGILLVSLFLSLSVFGQDQARNEEFWFTAGLANSHIFSDSLQTIPTNSFTLGMDARWEIKAPLFISGSTSYVRRGFQSLEQNASLKNNYLDIGISPQAELLPGLFLGPRLYYSSLIFSSLESQSIFTNFEKRGNTNTGYSSEWNLGASARIELQEGLEFGINMTLPKFLSRGIQTEFYVAFNPKGSGGESVAQRDRKEAYRHIMLLRESVLLVRLHTMEHSIAALREADHDEEADELEFKIKFQNERIIRAFNDHFDFCPVHYFYSYDSRAVRMKNYSEVLLDGVDLPIQTELPDSTSFYIADFGQLEPDTATYFLGYDWVSNGNFSGERVRVVYRPTTFTFGALKVRDSQFNQLRSPFPYWVKTYGAYLFKREVDVIIQRFNEKLYEFHDDAKSSYRIREH